ncbi:putative lipoprotein [Catalinimonas alkaloidigena]|uniref:imelysin family protein n=1 Tax=Catalinimonas alkaloidigena TaxID=1075417 RepID=UPI002404BEE1|nr:imelysin family protein [Catalinimonas alkaloidigena]MDF9797789.1 putative lipoprotein [Catalinimonas alkaloidigena]
MQTHKIYFVLLLTFFSACDDTDPVGDKVNFDREAMLVNMADGLIIPAYAEFTVKVNQMDEAIIGFSDSPSAGTLENVQSALLDAWKVWQYVAYFEFGPAMEVNLRNQVNIFPTDTEKITANIQQGDYDLDAASNAAAKGFPALDYLLFGVGETQGEILTYYADANLAAARKAYLQNLSTQIKELSTTVNQRWQEYRAEFVSNLGTEVGSSTGLLVNELNYEYDIIIKNGKVGIPAGKKSLGVTRPENVEALYSGKSLAFIEAGLQAFHEIFTGTTYQNKQNQSGMEDYLDALDATYQGAPLSDAIINQLNDGIGATSEVSLPLAEAVNEEKEAVDQAYLEIQRLVALIKVDMTSALGVLITFQDNDGD